MLWNLLNRRLCVLPWGRRPPGTASVGATCGRERRRVDVVVCEEVETARGELVVKVVLLGGDNTRADLLARGSLLSGL